MARSTQPANHHVTLADRYGAHIHGTVVYAKRLGHGRGAKVHIETQDVLEVGYAYQATYAMPSQSAAGVYTVFALALTKNQRWVARGIFMRT